MVEQLKKYIGNIDMALTICPYMSSNPYFVGCDNGYLTLLPHGVKCETICGAWENGHCIRLSEGKKSSCTCGDVSDATKTN